jgi:hypothetical protein
MNRGVFTDSALQTFVTCFFTAAVRRIEGNPCPRVDRYAGAAKSLLMVVVSPAVTLVPIVSGGTVILARIAIFE